MHTAGAFLLVAFLVGHVYLITTGRTLSSNLRAMITGWEDLEVEPQPEALPPSLEREEEAAA